MLVPAAEIDGAKYYAYKVDGPFGPGFGERFDRGKVLRPLRPRHFSSAGFQSRGGARTRS